MTPQEANQTVTAALELWVESLEDRTEGQGIGMMGDWLAVVSMVDVGSDGVPKTQYYVALKDGTMLPHVAKGLLYQGLEEMEYGGDDDA